MLIRRKHSHAALVTAISQILAVAAATQAAHAQEESGEVIEEVVVSGFRASLADALQRKRDSVQIVESVTAEDLGKFPDQNITESLQRLSGVQIDRIAGQGTQVRIRGLGQNITLLDEDLFVTGLELYKLGEGNDRFLDSLESIPSELIGGVDVYKSPSANLVEGAIGGTINLRTRRSTSLPDGLTIGGNLRANQSDYLDDWEPSGAVVAAYNADGRFGAVISFSYDKLSIHEDALQGQNRGNWRFIDGLNGADGSPNADEANFFDTVGTNYISPELLYTTHRDQYRERQGVSIGFDWAPNDAMQLGLDWFHSDLDVSTEEVGNKVWFTSNNLGRGIDPGQPFVIDANGVVREATFRAAGVEVISFVQAAEAKSDNYQLDFAYDAGGPWRFGAKATYAQADLLSDSANNDVTKWAYAVPLPDAGSPTGFSHQTTLTPGAPSLANLYTFRYNNSNGYLPSVTYNAPFADVLTNPNYGLFKSHWAFGDRTDNEAYSLRGDVQFEPAFIEAHNVVLSGGVRHASRDVSFVSGRYLADWSNSGEVDGHALGLDFGPYFYFQDGAIGNRGCDFPAETGLTCARFGNSPLIVTPLQTFVSNPERVERIDDFFPTGSVGSAITAANRAGMRNPAAWLRSLYPTADIDFFVDAPESFGVDEEVNSFYVMADVGGREDRYHLNVGTRFVDTSLDVAQNGPVPGGRIWGSDTWNGVIRDFETVTTSRSYTDILPSMNLTLDLTEQQKLRFAGARVMARPDLFALARGFQTFFTRESRDLNGDGDATDPGEEGFAFTGGSAGNPELDPFRATQIDLGWEYYFGAQNAILVTAFWKEVDSFIAERTAPEVIDDDFGGTAGSVTRQINGTGGDIKGFEIGAHYLFDFGLGFVANYTYSDSTSPIETSFDSNLPIPGVSEHSYNVQGYYEHAKFAARLSYAWRDQYLSSTNTTFGFDGVTYGVFHQDYGQLDGQISYQITDNFGVLLEAVNITEEDRKRFLQFDSQPFTYNSGERRIFVGVRGNFGGGNFGRSD